MPRRNITDVNRNRTRIRSRTRTRTRPRTPPTCSKCGQTGHTRRNLICPQYSKIIRHCSSCHSTEHNSRTCPRVNEHGNNEHVYDMIQRYNTGDASSGTDDDNPYGFDISGGNPSDTFGYMYMQGWNRASSEDGSSNGSRSDASSWN